MSEDNRIVVAAHTDIMGSVVDRYRQRGEAGVFEKRHAPILRAGGVDVFVDHLGGDTRYGFVPAPGLKSDPLSRAMRLFDHALVEEQDSGAYRIIRSIDDIFEAKAEGKLGMVMALEGGSPLNGDLAMLRHFFRLGMRSFGLTHNWRNALGDGCLERTGGGLSHFGKAVVEECNRLGIVVDVAHLSADGVADVLEISEDPIIASHTNPSAIAPHPHNLSDDLLRGIAERGGVIGVFFLNPYLTTNPTPTVADIVRVITYLLDLVGEDHIALGPDIMENWNQQEFKAVTEGGPTFESAPIKTIDYEYPPGYASVAALPSLRTVLEEEGFSDEVIDKIFGGNCLRLWSQVWQADRVG